MKVALIGKPVYHSKSPDIYADLFAKHGVDGSFSVFQVDNACDIKNIVQKHSLDAFAVTMPYKKQIIPYLDCVSQDAKILESVNFAVNKDGRLYGYTTDGAGFVKSLFSMNYIPHNKNIVICGYGGAASSVVQSLKKENAHITVTGRNTEKAKSFAKKHGTEHCDMADIPPFDMFINATPQGMTGIADYEHFDFLDRANKDALVYDMVYEPKKTTLLHEAEKRGINAVNGEKMLYFQAETAFEILLEMKGTKK